jgi:predicted nucleic acid-binding protein
MLNIYLDTNIYIIGLLYQDTNSARILKSTTKGAIRVIQSDYLYDEVLTWFRQHKGKDFVGSVRSYMLSIPLREFIPRHEWALFLDRLKDRVTDVDDLPHICSYMAGNCDYFITTNRKLTQDAVNQSINFKNPREFVEEILHLDGIETERGI